MKKYIMQRIKELEGFREELEKYYESCPKEDEALRKHHMAKMLMINASIAELERALKFGE